MRRSGFLVAVAAPLSVAVMTAGPVRAATEECYPTTGVFSPGQWQSSSLEMGGQVDDGVGTLNSYASGSFALQVDDTGGATGGLSLEGVAGSVMNDPDDTSNMTASFTVDAQLMGTGAMVSAIGEMVTNMSGSIDVRGADGYSPFEEEYGTDEDAEFGNTFTTPWETTITPTSANCNQAVGTFGGTLEYGDDGALQTYESGIDTIWYAFKLGGSRAENDIESEFVKLMDDAEFVLNMDPVDTDVLAQFVYDMLAFDSVLASAEYCDKVDLGALAPGNPAYQLLQSTMLKMMHTFLQTAEKGAYATKDVIYVTSLFLQSMSLGWRGANGDCLQPNSADEAAGNIFVRIEDVLITRYGLAFDGNDRKEMAMIAAAAYQFAMPRLIAAVEATPGDVDTTGEGEGSGTAEPPAEAGGAGSGSSEGDDQ